MQQRDTIADSAGDILRMLEFAGLKSYLRRLDQQLLSVAAGSPNYHQPIAELIKAGGKRLRPIVTYLAANSGTPDDKLVIIAGSAVELTHLASLLHDDIIDEAATRRGRPAGAQGMGHRQAILAGDYLLSRAFAMAAPLGGPAVTALSDIVSSMAEAVSEEINQSESSRGIDAHYLKIAHQKTAGLFELAGRMGGELGGLPQDQLDSLGRYGGCFGVAFQIIDDCLDDHFQKPFNTESKAARAYVRRAAKELNNLPPGPAVTALQRLLDSYWRSTLGR